MTLQADLAEATMLRQHQEETLRLRERELTALKGALKEEVECHDKEMEALREQYTQDMDNLRSTMEEFTQVRGNVFSQYHMHAQHRCFQPQELYKLFLSSLKATITFETCWNQHIIKILFKILQIAQPAQLVHHL